MNDIDARSSVIIKEQTFKPNVIAYDVPYCSVTITRIINHVLISTLGSKYSSICKPA